MTHDVSQVVEAFAAYQRARGLSERTIRRRRAMLRKLPDPLSVDLVTIEAVLGTLTAPETRKAFVGDLRAFYRWARRRRLVDVDPTGELEPIKVPGRLATPIPVADVRRMLAAAPDSTRLAIKLGAYAGLRASEIGRLHADDVRVDLGVIVVRDGKGGRSAVLPLHPRIASAVDGRSGFLFGPTSGDVISARIRRVMRALGIPGRPHDLRHTFGTEVARLSGGNLPLTAQLLRHRSYATSQRYIDWTPSGADVVAQVLVAA